MTKKCPKCEMSELKVLMTEQGSVVDYCPKCKGIWLDNGDIFSFAKDKVMIKREFEKGLEERLPSQYRCPVTGKDMIKIPILNNTLTIHYCMDTHGVWIDAEALENMPKMASKEFSLTFDRKSYEHVVKQTEREAKGQTIKRVAERVIPLPLPNLIFRSATVIVGLYGLLVLILITLVEFTALPLGVALLIGLAIASFQFLVSPFIMDLSLRWFYKMSWVEPMSLPPNLNSFIEKICRENKMRYPRIGLIHDGSPNAFTYGHHPNNARVVVTQGILDLLSEEEAQGVVAHEIGHAKHWDMLIMTAAQLVPLILYYVYRTVISIRSDDDDKSAPYRVGIAVGAYVLYIISQYLVLWLSRTREYYADRFAGKALGNPNFLSSALVKIGYGLAGEEPKRDNEKAKSRFVQRNAKLEAVGALGIFDAHTARSLAVTGYNKGGSMGGEVNKENLKGAMRWDMWNPWAKYYELHSTHPLIANRLRYLSNQAAYMGLEPYIVFDEVRPESYWDEFLIDLFVKFAPLLVLIIFGGLYFVNPNGPFLGMGVLILGLSYLFQITFGYRHDFFPDMTVANLLKKVKVSSIRPVPCTLKGRVIGRGVPGLIWSEDFVLQDDSGIIFLDYRQPLRIWEFLFAIFRRESLQNEEVTLTGWYRRSPVPYIELRTLSTRNKTRACYVYYFKLASAVILIALGCFLLLGSLF